MNKADIFEPFSINNVTFENRVLRSSVGGRTCNYDGTVTDVWKNFEKRFADGGIGAMISTTFIVNQARLSPFQYPCIADDKYIAPLRKYISEIRGSGANCKYIVQIGDPGYSTYVSLFPQEADGASSSPGFELAFGYTNKRRAMSEEEIETSIDEFGQAARRARDAGADGIEITITKGYLIHQFLNPGINFRNDRWGGDPDRRFYFLERIIGEVRKTIGRDFMVGVRLSGADYNYSPIPIALFRFPWPFLSRERLLGNELPQMIDYAKRLRDLGVDYLHVVSGYGFPNPRDVPGKFPFDEIRMFFDSNRHLSQKAALRAALLHALPEFITRPVMGWSWRERPEGHRRFAKAFKAEVGLPVILNGGFQERAGMDEVLGAADCDLISMARGLIATPDLIATYKAGKTAPDKPCTHCNRCVGRTTTSPLGCYEPQRFASQDEMLAEILEWNRPDPV